jgi:predicted peptidase
MRSIRRPRLWVASLSTAAALVLTITAGAEGGSLSELGDTLDIDRTGISLSGVSSGAYMAQQFHVAHSSKVVGVGIIAGGPYDCARGSYFWSPFDYTGLYAALYVCSATGAFGLFNGPPDVRYSVAATRAQARAGTVDDPANLAADRIWLFSGANDDKIPQPVVESLATYYAAFVSPDNIVFQHHPEANHAMITDDFGNGCDVDGTPYINDCDFDAANALLQQIHGPEPLAPKAAESELAATMAFDQTEFFDPSDNSISLHAIGHIYVPASCAAGARCRLHVAFHGCRQYQDEIGDAFYNGAGYNEVADTNNIVVLYPQTTAWSGGWFSGKRKNPHACWDWWGYSGEDFSHRAGKQIQAVAKMINTLIGRDLLPMR